MISQELPLSMRILEMLKLFMVVVITKEKIWLGIEPTFSMSLNPKMGLFYFSSSGVPHFLSIVINSMIFLFKVPIDSVFG